MASTVRQRERDLVVATRALFDERGMQEAPIEEIARSVGIARGLVYRHFSSKEELYVLTITHYLEELDGVLGEAIDPQAGPAERLEQTTHAYAGFCERYPAFLDCSLSLMHRPARALYEMVSESVWQRLGLGMARCIDHLTRILRDGAASGVFAVEDPDRLANVLWTQTLGAMHLARIRVGVRLEPSGMPALFPVAAEDVVAACVRSALATVGAVSPATGARSPRPGR